MDENKKNLVLEQSVEFAVRLMDYCELLEHKKKYLIARQLLKSGTSIGANIKEAQNAESRADFIHKVKLAAKEAEESNYWLTLCNRAYTYPKSLELQDSLNGIIKLLSKILSTAISNSR